MKKLNQFEYAVSLDVDVHRAVCIQISLVSFIWLNKIALVISVHRNGSDDGIKYRWWKTEWARSKKLGFIVSKRIEYLL